MKWTEAAELLERQMTLIAKPLPPRYWGELWTWQERSQLVFREEHAHKQQVDAAMRQFSVQRNWPALPQGSLSFLVGCRVLCALDTINILLAADDRYRMVAEPNAKQSDEVLTWLLIDTWNSWRWDSYLKLEAVRSLGDSFYGADAPKTSGN